MHPIDEIEQTARTYQHDYECQDYWVYLPEEFQKSLILTKGRQLWAEYNLAFIDDLLKPEGPYHAHTQNFYDKRSPEEKEYIDSLRNNTTTDLRTDGDDPVLSRAEFLQTIEPLRHSPEAVAICTNFIKEHIKLCMDRKVSMELPPYKLGNLLSLRIGHIQKDLEKYAEKRDHRTNGAFLFFESGGQYPTFLWNTDKPNKMVCKKLSAITVKWITHLRDDKDKEKYIDFVWKLHTSLNKKTPHRETISPQRLGILSFDL